MTRFFLLTAGLTLIAGTAHAQVQPWPGVSAYDQHRYEADRHRQAMDQQRRDADSRQAQAARGQAEARAAAVRIEATRMPDLSYPGTRQPAPTTSVRPDGGFPAPRPGGDVGQIDAWLYRPN